MIRKRNIEGRRAVRRLFVEDCVRIPVERRLIAAALPPGEPALDGPRDLVLQVVPVANPTGTARLLPVTAVPTAQRLGGIRWWWSCPACGCRCGVLLSPAIDSPFACRRCWGAAYASDYPSRQRERRLVDLVRGVPGGRQDRLRELADLLAPRRRGVRRGRRLRQRAQRLRDRLAREQIASGACLLAWSGRAARRAGPRARRRRG